MHICPSGSCGCLPISCSCSSHHFFFHVSLGSTTSILAFLSDLLEQCGRRLQKVSKERRPKRKREDPTVLLLSYVMLSQKAQLPLILLKFFSPYFHPVYLPPSIYLDNIRGITAVEQINWTVDRLENVRDSVGFDHYPLTLSRQNAMSLLEYDSLIGVVWGSATNVRGFGIGGKSE